MEGWSIESDEAISSDLNLKLFYYCIVCLRVWLFSKQRDSHFNGVC